MATDKETMLLFSKMGGIRCAVAEKDGRRMPVIFVAGHMLPRNAFIAALVANVSNTNTSPWPVMAKTAIPINYNVVTEVESAIMSLIEMAQGDDPMKFLVNVVAQIDETLEETKLTISI